MKVNILRKLHELAHWHDDSATTMRLAFVHIEQQNARITELEKALRDLLTRQAPASFAGAMRRARAALEGKKDE